MNSLQKRLTSLYQQKELIQKEILTLEAELNVQKKLSKEEKIHLFQALFISRDDIYAKKWQSKDQIKESFYPVTSTFQGEDYLPLNNSIIEQHLRGMLHLASYVISSNNLCKFVVLKISKHDISKLYERLQSLSIEGYLQIDSKADYAVWIFFEESIQAKNAKAFAQYILRYANIRAQIYPNQEFVNHSNLGDYIELPLHLQFRNQNRTIFVDFQTQTPINDQWYFLNNVTRIPTKQIKKWVLNDSAEQFNANILNEVSFPLFTLELFIYDYLYIPLKELSTSFINHLKSLACFDNPQIKTLLALRRPLYNTPKIIRSYEEDEFYLKLPRGLIKRVIKLFETHGIEYSLTNKTFEKAASFPKIGFKLREEQALAIEKIMEQDFSICVAPPGFGKTLIGAKIIQLRQVNCLVIVNKNMLLDQWRDRFVDYFSMNKKEIGFLGKGKKKLNNRLDVATMQSLKNNPTIIQDYSLVIVDECHHIPAVTFEQIIKNFQGKYILGLSATPNRKDGFEPILFQQLGPIAYEYRKKRTLTHDLQVIHTEFTSTLENYAQIINELCIDNQRNDLIIEQIKKNHTRKILVLTDRIEHINKLQTHLMQDNINYVTIHGSLTKKEQNENMKKVEHANLILATTSFFGEGIDFPHLNTIIFATPISYYGRLVQYLGRIGRDGQTCLAIDLLDAKNPILNSAYKKRAQGYKQMHYKLIRG